MKRLFLLPLLWWCAAARAQEPEPASADDGPRDMAMVLKAADALLLEADNDYLSGLTTLFETNRVAGNLDAVVTIDAERKRFSAFPQLDDSHLVKEPPDLLAYQTESLARFAEAAVARHRAVLSGAEKLEAWYAGQVKAALAAGKLSEANRLSQEQGKVRSHPAWLDASDRISKLPPPAPSSSPDPVIPAEPRMDWSLYTRPKASSAGYLWKFEDPAGIAAVDSAGKVAFELLPGLSFGEGRNGRGLEGSGPRAGGSMRYLGVPSNFPGQEPNGAKAFTLASWIWIDRIDHPLGIMHRRSSRTRSFKLEVAADLYPEFSVYAGDQKSELRAPRALVVGQWQHIAVTYDFKSKGHSPVRLYLNGDLAASRADFDGPPNASSDEAVFLGGALAADISRKSVMKWKLDDLAVIPRVLNGVEVKALAK